MTDLLVETDTTVPAAAPTTRRLGRGRLVLRRFLRNRLAVAGATGIILMVVSAIVAPALLPWTFDQIDSGFFLSPPGARHWLGTSQSGRDVLAMTVHGMSRSLIIGFVVAILQTTIACAMGATAAYFGRWTDRTIMWVIDLFQIVPSFLAIAVLMKGYSNPDNSWILLAFLLAGWGWVMTARVVRSLTLSLKNREYILAAKYMGLSPWRIITRHILPNISSLLIVDLTLGVGYAILAETGLSFLGFGVMAPDTSLGTLISEGSRMATTYPWVFAGPAVVLVCLVMCVNAVGDGLRDALDPNSLSGGRA